MASSTSSSLEQSTFVVELLRLRNFPPDAFRVDLFATFAYETQSLCGISVPPSGGITSVGRSLKWQLDNQTLADIKSIGVSACKLTFCASSGKRLGWVVLDLRTARTNSRKQREEGSWIALSGLTPGSGAVPEAQIKYQLNDCAEDDARTRSCPTSPVLRRDYNGGRLTHVKNVLGARGLNDGRPSSASSDGEPSIVDQSLRDSHSRSTGSAGSTGVPNCEEEGCSPSSAQHSRGASKDSQRLPSLGQSVSAEAPQRPPLHPQHSAEPPGANQPAATAAGRQQQGQQRQQQPQHAGHLQPVLPMASAAGDPNLGGAAAGGMPVTAAMPGMLPGQQQAMGMYGMLPGQIPGMPGAVPGMFGGYAGLGGMPGMVMPATTAAISSMGMPTGSEVRGAWELEVWRTQEEQRFRTELERRAQQKLEELEAQWQQRETARRAEHTEVTGRYSKLETKARQVLESLEEREAKLYEVERELERKRLALDRQADRTLLEADKKLGEAEAAMQALRIECNGQLEAERARNAELARQKSAVEARCSQLEAKCSQLEATIKGLRDTYDGSNEGALRDEVSQLRQDLDRARHAQHKAESKAKKASSSRDKYKQQIVRMGHDLGALQQALQSQLNVVLAQQQAMDKSVMAGKAGGISSTASAQLKQIQELKSNLVTLQATSGLAARPHHSRMPSDESTLSAMSGLTSVSQATASTAVTHATGAQLSASHFNAMQRDRNSVPRGLTKQQQQELDVERLGTSSIVGSGGRLGGADHGAAGGDGASGGAKSKQLLAKSRKWLSKVLTE